MEKFAFYALTAVTFFAAAIVVTRRNITHAVIAFGAAFFAVAGVFLLLKAASPFALQLLLVFTIASILYSSQKRPQNESPDSTSPQSSRVNIVAVSIAIFLLAQVAGTVLVGSKLSDRGLLLLAAASSATQTLKMSEVLHAMIQSYLLPCEIVVVLVLLAGVARGAIRRSGA